MSLITLPTVQNAREQNRADQRRLHAIRNVEDRIDVYAALAVTTPGDAALAATRRRFATGIVDAVVAELRGGA
jgi:hypothetical protein